MSNPTDVMDDVNVLERDKCAAETGTKKRKYHQIQTADDNLPKRTWKYSLSNIPENYEMKCDGKKWLCADGLWSLYAPTKFIQAKKLCSGSETNNSLQVIIEHLTGKQLSA